MKLLGVVFDPVLEGEAAQARVERRQAAYRVLLDDLDGAVFEAACRHAAGTLRFFPKPVELREAAAEVLRREAAVGREEELAERLALTEARAQAEQEISYGVWDPERGRSVRSGEPAEAIYARWRRLALARLEQLRAARERGERPEDG